MIPTNGFMGLRAEPLSRRTKKSRGLAVMRFYAKDFQAAWNVVAHRYFSRNRKPSRYGIVTVTETITNRYCIFP